MQVMQSACEAALDAAYRKRRECTMDSGFSIAWVEHKEALLLHGEASSHELPASQSNQRAYTRRAGVGWVYRHLRSLARLESIGSHLPASALRFW
jgi:hypothetical protein